MVIADTTQPTSMSTSAIPSHIHFPGDGEKDRHTVSSLPSRCTSQLRGSPPTGAAVSGRIHRLSAIRPDEHPAWKHLLGTLTIHYGDRIERSPMTVTTTYTKHRTDQTLATSEVSSGPAPTLSRLVVG
jgi:hypothetical protein